MDKNCYIRAEQFLPWNLHKVVHNTTLFPYWSETALYYFEKSDSVCILNKVDIINGKKTKIVDINFLIKKLSETLNKEISIHDLMLDKFDVREMPLRIFFNYGDRQWNYDLEQQNLIEIKMPKVLVSTDKKKALYIRNHNLYIKNLENNKDSALTTDGVKYYDYATSPETNTHTITDKIDGTESEIIALWSPDSNKIITHKLDQRNVEFLYLLQNSPKNTKRPKLFPYKMSFSGDENLPIAELIIINVKDNSIIPVQADPILSPYLTPLEFKWLWWSQDSRKIYFLRESRGSKEIILCVADADSGKTEIIIKESSKTYIEPSQFIPWPTQIIILEDQNKIIWLSEKSGYSHLYLYDIGNEHPAIITQGEWSVREVYFYDEEADWLYFSACGYHQNVDPYYKQLYRCRLDGSQMECLTNEPAHHTIQFSPFHSCFLNTYSTINKAPVSCLKDNNGNLITPLIRTDLTKLKKMGWVDPQRLILKARDGITNIYGNLYFPSNFDPEKKYPIIDHIYPGPQVYRTQPHFSLYGAIFRSQWTAQALAELGFVVIHIDGFGTPGRSKHFHDYTYEHMSDCGIPDHVAAIRELSAKYSFIDIEKVGITGYSGGGYAAARAILTFPDFFKVAVAAAGNHDLRCYPASYGEKYNGLDKSTYESQSSAAFADNLKGKLLLIHGEMDDNVHPCATLQLVDALIEKNKYFDMLIMPNQNHRSTFDHPYYYRRHWDYFVQHLLGNTPPNDYKITPMPKGFPQIRDWL